MRGLWSTISLVVVLAGLGAYIYFVESERDPAGVTTREKVFDGVTTEDLTELEIKSADGDTTRLQKTDGAWRLVDPVEAAADESEVTSIATSLASLEVNRVVEEEVADLAQYGLEPARIEVAFKKAGEAEFSRVLIGEKTPTGGDLYARAQDSNRVFLIASYLESTFNKNTFSLRDRRILVFDRNSVDGLELTDGSTKTVLAKAGSEWRLTSPVSARADFSTVEGALGRLASTQMQGIVESEETNLAKYGLNRPSGTIAVVSGSSRATLTLGSIDNALLFARDSSRPMVFTVAPILRDDVMKSVADLRRKDLFDSRAFTATRAEFTRGAETVTFEKTKGADDADVWRSGGQDKDRTKVDDLLSKVTGLRAQSFEDSAHPSLRTPELVVTIGFDEKTETVRLARSGSDLFASRPDEPGAAKLEAARLDDVLKALDELK